MAWAPAQLPDPGIRLIPDLCKAAGEPGSEPPGNRQRTEPAGRSLVKRCYHLAEHVQLNLLRSRVPHAHRPRTPITREPWQLPLGKPAFPSDPIHDLQLAYAPGQAPFQPSNPGLRLFRIARLQQGLHRESGIAQPTKPVIPVSHSPEHD